MPERAARGSLNGRWQARDDRRPNLQGVLTIERDLPAGATLHVAGWTRTAAGGEFVSLSAEVAVRSTPGRSARASKTEAEPEGLFASPGSSRPT